MMSPLPQHHNNMNYSVKGSIAVTITAYVSQFVLTVSNVKEALFLKKKKRIVIKSWGNQHNVDKMMKGALYDLYRSLNFGYILLTPSPWSVLVSLFQFTYFIF